MIEMDLMSHPPETSQKVTPEVCIRIRLLNGALQTGFACQALCNCPTSLSGYKCSQQQKLLKYLRNYNLGARGREGRLGGWRWRESEKLKLGRDACLTSMLLACSVCTSSEFSFPRNFCKITLWQREWWKHWPRIWITALETGAERH